MELSHIFYVITLVISADIGNVYSTYRSYTQPKSYNQWLPSHQRNHPDLCPRGVSGIFSHSVDCRKFLKCDRGRTFTMQCRIGTVFNDVSKVCDWPQNVNCHSRHFERFGNSPQNQPQYVSNQHHHGDFLHPHQQHPNSHHWPQQHTYSFHHQVPSPSPLPHRPPEPEPIIPFHNQQPQKSTVINSKALPDSQPDTNVHDRSSSVDDIVLSGQSSNRASQIQPIDNKQIILHRIPELNLLTPRIGNEYFQYFSKPISSTASKDNIIRGRQKPTILSITPQRFVKLRLLSPRIIDQFDKHFVNPTPKPTFTVSLSPKISVQQKQVAVYVVPNVAEHRIPYQHIAFHRFPLNLLTSRVGDEFYRHFAYPRSQIQPSTSLNEPYPNQDSPTPSSQIPFGIPDMSVLPLQPGKYPQNTYPEAEKQPTDRNVGGSSRGGDTKPDIFNEKNPVASDGKELFHSDPKLDAKLSPPIAPTPRPTTKPYSPLENYNRKYYSPLKNPLNENEHLTEHDNILISDTLKRLLRAQNNKMDSMQPKKVAKPNNPNSELFDSDENLVSEQNSLAAAVDNNANRIAPNSGDVETFAMTDDKKHVKETSTKQPPPISRIDSNNRPPKPTRRPQPPFTPTNASRPHSNQPVFHKPNAYDPNKIFFPGPHSESHPMQRQ